MEMFLNLWQYLVDFFLEGKMCQIKFVKKIKAYFMFSDFFLRSYPLPDNAENVVETEGPHMTSQCIA
jgi:hypothetical protein